MKSYASDGKDVEFKGEFKVSGDLYTNANIIINEVRHTDVTFQGQSTETPAKKAEWIQSGSRWWYKHADGSYTTNGWEKLTVLGTTSTKLVGWQLVGLKTTELGTTLKTQVL